MDIPKQKRDSKFESLRIIAMIMIIMFHTANTLKTTIPLSDYDWLLVHILGAWGILGVNIFVVLSALFFFQKHESPNTQSVYCKENSKIKELIAQTMTYVIAWSIAVHFLSNNTINTTISILIQDTICAPLFLNHYWFIWPYIGMRLALPFVNKIKPTRGNLFITIVLLVVSNNNSTTCVITETVHFILISVVVMHIVRIKQLHNTIYRHCFIGLIVTTLVILISSYGSYYISYHQSIMTLQPILTRIHMYGSRFSFMMIVNAILLVSCFSKLPSYTNKAVNYIATLMFGVYLFHTYLMYDFTHIAIRVIKNFTNSPVSILIESSFLTLVLGSIIESIRKAIAKKLINR